MDKLQSKQHQCLKIPQTYIKRVFCPIFLKFYARTDKPQVQPVTLLRWVGAFLTDGTYEV